MMEINEDLVHTEPTLDSSIYYKEFQRVSEPIDYSEFFEKFMQLNRPCIFNSSMTSSWRSIEDWNSEGEPDVDFFLKIVDGDTEVPVSNCDRRYFNSQENREQSLSSYIKYWKEVTKQEGSERSSEEKSVRSSEEISEGSPKERNETERMPQDCFYLKDWHLVLQTKDHYTAYSTPHTFCSDWLNEWWENREDSAEQNDYRFVYLGPRGSWTPCHKDVFGSYSWSANIVGRKKWTFFPPGEEVKLQDKFGNVVFDVDTQEAETLEKENGSAYRLEVIQNTGEVVFVPSGWYHQVVNLEDTVSINHNWFNGTNICTVYSLLREELLKVEQEIQDCKDDGEWGEMCQKLLAASYGMNFKDLLSLLKLVLNRRLKLLEGGITDVFRVEFDGVSLGVNHAKFDVRKIVQVLGSLAEDFTRLDMKEENQSCRDLLYKCKTETKLPI